MQRKFTLSALSTIALLALGSAAMAQTAPAKVADGVYVGANGMTLYTFDKDTTPGKSVCNGPCATNWPPLPVAETAKPMGGYTIIVREDGKRQWAYKGWPLYFWAKDTKAGDKTGDNVGTVWHVAKP